MKAISICQPWAWAITHGPKRVENRTWSTSYRGPLLIHASKSRRYWTDHTIQQLERMGLKVPHVDRVAHGALVGYTQLFSCCHVRVLQGRACWDNNPFVEGPYCLQLGSVFILPEPIPWRGNRGLFDVPDDTITLTNVVCRVCGCTSEQACAGGCTWVHSNLCGACQDKGHDWPGHPARADYHYELQGEIR